MGPFLKETLESVTNHFRFHKKAETVIIVNGRKYFVPLHYTDPGIVESIPTEKRFAAEGSGNPSG